MLVGVLGPDIDMYMSIVDPNADVQTLNAAGIVTVLNVFGSGVRLFGNRSAEFPTSTAVDNFIPVRRTADIIEESIQLYGLQYLDGPINNALINAVLADTNAFIRTLIQRGALVGGAVTYDPKLNPASQIAAGQIVFSIDMMPPTPAERLTFDFTLDTALLAQIGSTSASQQSLAAGATA